MKALIDSNIIIDFFTNKREAVAEVSKYNEIYISVITYIEVMTGLNNKERMLAGKFFEDVNIIDVSLEIANGSIKIKDQYKMKLPDAIILASAISHNIILVTRDECPAFKNHPYVRYPYKI